MVRLIGSATVTFGGGGAACFGPSPQLARTDAKAMTTAAAGAFRNGPRGKKGVRFGRKVMMLCRQYRGRMVPADDGRALVNGGPALPRRWLAPHIWEQTPILSSASIDRLHTMRRDNIPCSTNPHTI